MIKFYPLSEYGDVYFKVNGAKQAIRRLENGTPDTEATWFYEDKKDPQWIIDTVCNKLDDMTEHKDIAEWDKSKRDKFQPQGRSAPFPQRREHFDEYFAHLDEPSILKDKMFIKAQKLAVTRLRLTGNLVPRTYDEVVRKGLTDKKYGTSSGYPLFIKRKNPKAIEEAKSAAESKRCFQDKYPFTTGSRAQMGKVGPDARFIFMPGMATNLFGMRFSQPLQDHLRSLTHLYFFTPWEGWSDVQHLISSTWDAAPMRFGADYTKMDQHFNIHHGKVVFDVLKHAFAKEHWDDMWLSISYAFTAPVVTSEGVTHQEHALLSGSEWTNLIETVWNYVFVIYMNLKYNVDFRAAMGIGDDQLWFINGVTSESARDWLLKTVIDQFERAGLPGNPTKQDGVKDPSTSAFLQRKMWDNYNGLSGKVRAAGVYSIVRNVTSQVYPERYFNAVEWDRWAFAIRVIMIAENSNQHPLFEWYVKDFIANSNRNVLEFVRKSDSEVEFLFQEKKNIAGFIPSYNQEKQDMGLLSFDTFRLLREVG